MNLIVLINLIFLMRKKSFLVFGVIPKVPKVPNIWWGEVGAVGHQWGLRKHRRS